MSRPAHVLAPLHGAVDGRRVLAPPPGVPDETLVHALAQLPDPVTLGFAPGVAARRRLEKLAAAYGIDDRVHFDGGGQPTEAGAAYTFAELLEAMSAEPGPASLREGADGILAGHRIAIVTNVPTHYRAALLNRLAKRLARVGADLRVFFLAPGDPRRSYLTSGEASIYDHEIVDVVRVRGVPPVPRDLGPRLRRFWPTAVLFGGFSPFVGAAAARYASRAGIPFGIWSGEIASAATAESALRRRQRRLLVSRADFAIAYGHAAAGYLHSLAPELPLVYGRNSTLLPEPAAPRSHDVVEVLTVARAIPVKGLDCAVDAFARLRDLPCRLTVVGDGSELPALVRRANGNPAVRFLGALPPADVRKLYRDADVFLFPSREDVFGLVLVEAMGAGLPTVVSSSVGAVDDLALPGRNCLVAERDDVDGWTAAVRRLVAEPMLRRSLGARAAATIQGRWTIDHAVEGMVSGLRLAVLGAAT